MRRFLFPSVVTVAVLVGVMFVLYGGRFHSLIASRGPMIDCPDKIQVGPTEYGKLIEAHFLVSNPGDRQLVIRGFRSSCTCESIEVLEGDRFVSAVEVKVDPGKSIEMRIVMSIRERVMKSLQNPIFFLTNVPERPEVTVVVNVPIVLSGLSALPSVVAFGQVPINAITRHTVRLFDSRENARKIFGVRSDSNRVKVRLVKASDIVTDEEDKSRGLLVGVVEIVVDTNSSGDIHGTILVDMLDGSAMPDAIRVFGRVMAPVEVYPDTLHLPRATSTGSVYSGTCLVRCTLPSHVGKLTLQQAPKGVTVKVSDVNDGGLATLNIELNDEFPIFSVPQHFTVELSVGQGDSRIEIKIPVSVQPKEKK